METVADRNVEVVHYADMMSAMGNEQRLRIVRLLLQSHPEGMVAGDIQTRLGIPGSTLSHHLEKLKVAGVVTVRREGTYLRYMVNSPGMEGLLRFLFSECCAGSGAVDPECCFVPIKRKGGR
ncbi:MAG: winged helix-turn-helix transcriptional regulator [Candidatus Dadabacteria bacterium]|nr:winged helix-turn-helix transcriptional regulator [Candidatus Dadabacteria bacterium]